MIQFEKGTLVYIKIRYLKCHAYQKDIKLLSSPTLFAHKFHPIIMAIDWLIPKWLFVSFLDAFDFRRFLNRSVSQFRIIANVVNFNIKIWFLWFLVRSEFDDNVKLTKYHESFTINFSANITNIRACSCKKTHKHTNLDHNLVTRWGDKDVSHVDVHVQDMSHTYEVQIREGSKLWAFKLEFEKNLNLQTLIDTQVRWSEKRENRESWTNSHVNQ